MCLGPKIIPLSIIERTNYFLKGLAHGSAVDIPSEARKEVHSVSVTLKPGGAAFAPAVAPSSPELVAEVAVSKR